MKKIRLFLKDNWLILIILALIVFLTIGLNYKYIFRLLIDFKVLFQNIFSYFIHLFNSDQTFPKQVLEELTLGGSYFDILPSDFQTFIDRFGYAFTLPFKDSYLYFIWIRFINNFGSFALILSLFSVILPLMLIIPHAVYVDKEFEVDSSSLSTRTWYRLYKNIIYPIICFLKELFQKIINTTWFVIIFWICICWYLELYSPILNFFSYYFYFISIFDFSSLWDLFLTLFNSLVVIFYKVPLFFRIILYCYLFNKFRLHLGFNNLERNECCNFGFIKKTGVTNMLNGSPGSGKTSTMTDMTVTTEMYFRDQCLDIMSEIHSLFPHFRFDLLEKEIDSIVENDKIFKNPIDIDSYFRSQLYVLVNDSDKEYIKYSESLKTFYDKYLYDINKYDLEFDNGNIYENLFEDIIDYAKAYWIYQSNFALASSNYPIRFEFIKTDNGKNQRKSIIYDTFGETKHNELDHFSKILDYDTLRLGSKKIKPNNEHNGLTIGYAIALTEIGKERGNTLENREVKKSDDETNVKNDGFTDMMRVLRHPLTIRHRTFVKLFLDEQRCSSVGVALSGICENILTIDKNRNKNQFALPFYEFDDIILGFIENILKRYYEKRSHKRNDITLLYLFNMWLLKKVSRKLTYIHNTFDFKEILFYSENGTLPEGVKENVSTVVYYLQNKKIFSNRYASDYLRTFFDEKAINSSCGFEDLEEYQDTYPSWDDFDKQNSYFASKLKDEMNLVDNNTSDEDESNEIDFK